MGTNRKRNTEQSEPYSPEELAPPALVTEPTNLTAVDVPPPSTAPLRVGGVMREEHLALWADPTFVDAVREALGLGAPLATPEVTPVHQPRDVPPTRQPFFTVGQNSAEQIFAAGFLREDDPRFLFTTYTDVPMDGLAKHAARMPWHTYKTTYPGHTMESHFSHVVHWGASANLDVPAFCRMAAPLYGHTATFLLEQRLALAPPDGYPFASPAEFFNACVSLGDNIPSVADVRRQLEALKLTRETSFETYQSDFFRILREYGHYAGGREFKSNPFATAQAFLRGFSMKFRTLIDEHLIKSNLEVSNTTALLALTKRLWTTFPDQRYDEETSATEPVRQSDRSQFRQRRFPAPGGDQSRVAVHDARVTTGPGKQFSDLSKEDQETLKLIHKTMKKREALSPTQYSFCQKHFVCFSCGSLSHRAADCPKKSTTD